MLTILKQQAPVIDDNALILSLDQGGHSSRAIVFDARGQIVALCRYRLGVSRPRPGWVEQDAEQLQVSLQTVLQELALSLGADAARIQVAGLATQRSNSVCWNRRTGFALSPVISWQDTRTSEWLHDYQNYAEAIHLKTGLYLTAHYGATKLRWCIENLPAVAQAHQADELAWGPLASFLCCRLAPAQQHFVDPANASRTLLWNLESRTWDPELLACFAVPPAVLPRCVPTFFPYGRVAVGQHTVPLNIVSGDQSAALFGFGLPAAGTVYINVGTGAFIQCYTGDSLRRVSGLLSGIAGHDGNLAHYTLEGTVNGAGSALSLVEEQLGMDYRYAEANFAQWLEVNEDLPLFLNGVSGLGAPFWVPDFVSHFTVQAPDWKKIVAVAESILFLIMLNLQRLRQAGVFMAHIMITGGLASTDGLCQRLADLTGLPVHRPHDGEATARGIACLAAGLPLHWRDPQVRVFTVQPNPPLQQRFQAWEQAMQQALSEQGKG